MRHYPETKNLIATEVIVNGQPATIRKKRYYTVSEVVAQAIKETNHDLSLPWQIRNANGDEVHPTQEIGDYADDIIHVQLPPGIGA